MEPVWLHLGTGRRPCLVDPFGFLGASLFRCEHPDHERLDFLGFSRPNRDFSMGCATRSGNNFSRPFRAVSSAGMVAPRFRACGTAGLFMGEFN
jgi:hypothetical protein